MQIATDIKFIIVSLARYLHTQNQVMAAIKIILDTRTIKKDGTYPIKIQLFHRSTTYIGLDIAVKKEQWNGEEVIDHPKSKRYNLIIKNRMIQAGNMLLEVSATGSLNRFNMKELKAMVDGNTTEIKPEKKDASLITEHFERYIATLLNPRTAAIYRETLDKVNLYDPKNMLKNISYTWLVDFDTFLSGTCGVNTRAIHLRNIRAVYNDAMRRKLVDRNLYPFWDFRIKKAKTIKRHLTIEQMKTLRDYPVQPHHEKYRQLFMLTFYLIGINMVDLLRLKTISDGRVEYIRAKTGRFYSIEVLPEARAIFEQYGGKEFLLDVLDRYKNYKDFTARMNENLKEIGALEWVKNKAKDPKRVKKNVKHITPLFPDLIIYTARKSWATIASKLDIPKDTIAMALGHGTNTVTDDYIDFDMAKVDRANRDILKAMKS